MRGLKYAIFSSVMVTVASVDASVAFPTPAIDGTFSVSSRYLADDQRRPPGRILVARETAKTKTTVKTKNDGTVVVKEKTKTNDGQGNKSTTKTTTTTQPNSGGSSSGSGGASYEGY